MPRLFIRFGFDITNHDINTWPAPAGPLFHRWLPNGEHDALEIPVPEAQGSIKFWFERRGFVEGRQIKYDSERQEVQDALIPLQTILNGGAIRGQIELKKVTKTAFNAVTNRRIGNKSYEALGKKVVNKMLLPETNRLINILKYKYGQYWLNWDLNSWDSRAMSLGRFCYLNKLKWSSDGKKWADFLPTPQKTAPITLPVENPDYSQFLTAEDWKEIGRLLKKGFEHTLGAEVMYRAHRLKCEGRTKYALIEAVTALEVIIDWYYRSNLSKPLGDWDNGFLGQSISSKITATTALTGKIQDSDAKLALKAYKRRNEIVHDGKDIGDDAIELIEAVLGFCSALIQNDPARFPWADAWNNVYAEGQQSRPSVIVIEENFEQ